MQHSNCAPANIPFRFIRSWNQRSLYNDEFLRLHPNSGGKAGDKLRSAYYSHRNTLSLYWTELGESEPSRFASSSLLKPEKVSEWAKQRPSIWSPCIWCCLARHSMTCHTLLVQTASDTWSTHPETKRCCFACSNALPEMYASFCLPASLSNKLSIFQYFIWTGKEVR